MNFIKKKKKVLIFPEKLDILQRRINIYEKPHRGVELFNFSAEISKSLGKENFQMFPLIFQWILMSVGKNDYNECLFVSVPTKFCISIFVHFWEVTVD